MADDKNKNLAATEDEAPEENDPNLLIKMREPGYLLRVRLVEEQMECQADIEIIDEEQLLSASELLGLLHKVGVAETADQDAIVQFCQQAAAGNPQQNVLLAHGTEPVKGKDGWFELAIKVAGDAAEYSEDEHGYVDLRTLNSFTGLEPGSKIGTLHPPKNGVAGMTANGLSIPAEAGSRFDLVAGEGVVLKYEGRIAFAEKAGRALLEKQYLSVVDEYSVAGDVDLSIGNIDFNGCVDVKGDVLDDFHIKAAKGIRIEGVVGACTLESGGSVEIGSMSGKEVGRIVCHGDLLARYLNQVEVECHGNVIVANEIRNSNIKATGCIVVESGSVSGGHLVALEGIQADMLGSTSGIKTYLQAGIYFPEVDQLEYLRANLKSVNLQIKRVHAAIGPLEHLQTHEGETRTDQVSEQRLTILNQQWERLEQEKEQLVAELESFQGLEQSEKNPKVNAVKALLEGVVISLGNTTKEVKFEHTGPLSVIENSRSEGLRYLDLSPLQTKAQEDEKEILRAEIAQECDAVEADEERDAAEEHSTSETAGPQDSQE